MLSYLSGLPEVTVGTQLLPVYGAPVLLSGLFSLVMRRWEVETLNTNFKVYIKMCKKTPACVVFFLAGSLPFPLPAPFEHVQPIQYAHQVGRQPSGQAGPSLPHILPHPLQVLVHSD